MSFEPQRGCEGGAEALRFTVGGIVLIGNLGADFSPGYRAETYRSHSELQCRAR